MTQQNDHDLLIQISTNVETIKSKLDDIKAGRSQACIEHTQRLDNHWTHIKAQWWLWGAVAGAALAAFARYIGGL